MRHGRRLAWSIAMTSESQIELGLIDKLVELKYVYRPDIRDLDVLFINASEYFEKGKRQNHLLPEHIEKIVQAYQFRKEEERYSRRVSMKEIAGNDYNLNISRYISTAVAEEEIDLAAVHADLVAAEEKIAEATQKHNEFLKELGLPLLPCVDEEEAKKGAIGKGKRKAR